MNKTFLRWILVALVTSCAICAGAAETTPASADVAALQDQTRALDKDLASLKESSALKLEAQDRRIDGLGYSTAQQANILAAVSVQTASVANYIAFTSIGIALIVFIAGFITYFSATARAVKEANDASQAWFEKNGGDLDARLLDLRKDMEVARGEIDQIRKRVKDDADEASKSFSELGRKLFASAEADKGAPQSAPDPTAVAAVQEKSESLRAKPETDFTAEDYWARGLADYTAARYEAALQAFQYGLALVEGVSTARDMHSQLLLAVGTTLGQLGRSQEAIAVYDQVVQVYGSDSAPSMRLLVVNALFNKGYAYSQQKQFDDARVVYTDIDARYGRDTDPAMREQVAKIAINLGIVLGQLGRDRDALAFYQEILRRYALDTAPVYTLIRSQAFNNAACSRVLLAKKGWSSQNEREALLVSAIEDARRASDAINNEDKGTCMGNLGYALFLHHQFDEAEKATREALRLDGSNRLDMLRGDAQKSRVEPEDTRYEEMLARVWESLG